MQHTYNKQVDPMKEINRGNCIHACCVLQVVQDFVQQTADEETHTEWLHRIMETNSREEGDYDINLLGMGMK